MDTDFTEDIINKEQFDTVVVKKTVNHDELESLRFQVEILTNKLKTAEATATRLVGIQYTHNQKIAKIAVKMELTKRSLQGIINKLNKELAAFRNKP